jgi:hypothetical protein
MDHRMILIVVLQAALLNVSMVLLGTGAVLVTGAFVRWLRHLE